MCRQRHGHPKLQPRVRAASRCGSGQVGAARRMCLGGCDACNEALCSENAGGTIDADEEILVMDEVQAGSRSPRPEAIDEREYQGARSWTLAVSELVQGVCARSRVAGPALPSKGGPPHDGVLHGLHFLGAKSLRR